MEGEHWVKGGLEEAEGEEREHPGCGRDKEMDSEEARSRVSWPGEYEETAQTVDGLQKPCGGLVAVPVQGVATTH